MAMKPQSQRSKTLNKSCPRLPTTIPKMGLRLFRLLLSFLTILSTVCTDFIVQVNRFAKSLLLSYIPHTSPGVPRFYDISGMTQNPAAFQLCIDIFVKRYAGLAVDAIAGLDARGFVLGPPIALALKLPFIMIRKKGKLPNAVTGEEYRKEYEGANANGGDELCISRTAIKDGARVLVIDDLVATGVSISTNICLCNSIYN